MDRNEACPTCQVVVAKDDLFLLLADVDQIRVALGNKKNPAPDLTWARSANKHALKVLIRLTGFDA